MVVLQLTLQRDGCHEVLDAAVRHIVPEKQLGKRSVLTHVLAKVLNLNDLSTPSPEAVSRQGASGRETSSSSAGVRVAASEPGEKLGATVDIGARWGQRILAVREVRRGRRLSMVGRDTEA